MVSFMYEDLKSFVKELMQLVVQPDVVGKCKTGKQFQTLDLSDSSNLLSS